MTKPFLVLAAAVLTLAAATPAGAQVSISFGFNPFEFGDPPPVIYQPRRPYYPPPVVYYGRGGWGGQQGRRDWHDHGRDERNGHDRHDRR